MFWTQPYLNEMYSGINCFNEYSEKMNYEMLFKNVYECGLY